MSETTTNHLFRTWIHTISKWLLVLLDLGVSDDYSNEYNSKVRLYNKLNLLVCVSMVPIMLFDLLRGYYPGLAIAGSIFLTTSMSYWLMHKGQFFIVAWGSIIIVTLGIIFLILFYGRDIGGELTFLVIGLSCIVLFDSRKSRLILLIFIFCAYILSEVLLQFIAPFTPEAQMFPVYLVIFGTNFLLSMILMIYFTKQGEQMEKEVNDLMEDLTIRNVELENANSDLAQFAYAASHHFKSPLKNISNLLGLIEKKLPKETLEQHGNYLDLILSDSKHLYRLVEDILTYSTLDSSTFDRKAQINMPKVLERVANNLSEELNFRHVKLSVQEFPALYASETHIELMLQILIQNGFYYNEAKIPVIEISGTIDQDETVSLKVSDNGIGIPIEYQDQVFEMFERLHPNSEYQGTGIGLTVCRRIMQGYGGRIKINSARGEGTTMTLIFPPKEEHWELT